MALVTLLLLLLSIYVSFASSSLPLLSPLTKDPSSLRYTAAVGLQSPPRSAALLLHLGASSSWIDCSAHNVSSSSPVPCTSSLCFSCPNNTCSLLTENPVARRAALAPALLDALSLPSTDGHNPGSFVALSSHVLSCSISSFLRKGLPRAASGLLALGRSNSSFPAQASFSLSLPNVFALCLSGSPSAPGVAFFGSPGPYYFLAHSTSLNPASSLNYTPIIPSPSADGNPALTHFSHPSVEYYVGLTAVRINGKQVRVDPSLFHSRGTKLSTVAPYTAMHTSIYTAFVASFIDEAEKMNLARKAGVKPFEVCYDSEDVGGTVTGPAVPAVDLVLRGEGAEKVVWRISGGNVMAWAERGSSLCLAFVDGGRRSGGAAVVVGGHQMEDFLVQVDLERMRVGFSSSLLEMGSTCANFNFSGGGI